MRVGRLFHGSCRQAFEAIGLRSGCRRKVNPHWCKKAESVHVETDRNSLVFPFKTTQSLPFALRPADEPHFFCLKRRKPGCQR